MATKLSSSILGTIGACLALEAVLALGGCVPHAPGECPRKEGVSSEELERARSEAFRDGREAALAEGREAGYANGLKEGRKQGAAEEEAACGERVDKAHGECAEDLDRETAAALEAGAKIGLENLAWDIETELLEECWQRRAQKPAPARKDALEDQIHQWCTEDLGGCDIQRIAKTSGCWAEAEIRVRGDAASHTCGFFDRPRASACEGRSAKLCEEGWEYVSCHWKQAGSSGTKKKESGWRRFWDDVRAKRRRR